MGINAYLSQRLIEKVKSQISSALFLSHRCQNGQVAGKLANATNVLLRKLALKEVGKLQTHTNTKIKLKNFSEILLTAGSLVLVCN